MSASSEERPLREVLLAWDAIAIRWRLDGQESGSLMPGGLTGPLLDPASWRVDAAERRIRLLVRIGELAAGVHRSHDALRWWLRRPNAALGGHPPLEAMAESEAWLERLATSLEMVS